MINIKLTFSFVPPSSSPSAGKLTTLPANGAAAAPFPSPMLRLQLPLCPAALPPLHFPAGDLSSSGSRRRPSAVPQRGFFCIIRKTSSRSLIFSRGKFTHRQFSYLDNSCIHGTIQRDVIVRSELANTSASLSFPEYDVVAKARGICFYTVTAVFALILFQMMLVAHPFVLLLDQYKRNAHQFIARIWSTLTVALFYKIEVYGRENLPPSDVPALYVSNHQSFLDIYTLLTLGRNFKFISKTSIFHFPIIGWAMSMMGTIPLKRMDSRSQLECLKQCMHLIQNGASVCVFPEGTRSKDGKLGEFKKGAFTISAKTKVPVVPIALVGTGKIMPAGHEGILNPGTVKVIIHKPIEGKNAEALCSEARSVIASSLNGP